MKLSDLLKKIGLNLDDDVDVQDEKNNEDKEKDINMNNNRINNDSGSDKNNDIESPENKKEGIKLRLEFDETTGQFKTEGIEDADVVAVLNKANAYNKNRDDKVLIDKAFDSKLNSLKIRKGITTDAVRALVKTDNITVKDGQVIGVDEAFENLQKEQSGLFVQRNNNDSSPVLEGFNPVDSDKESDATADIAALANELFNSVD